MSSLNSGYWYEVDLAKNPHKYPHTTIPEKHLPKDRISLAILQEIALEISLVMTRAKSREDILVLHTKAIQQAKQKALDYGVVHLIEWDTFLLNT